MPPDVQNIHIGDTATFGWDYMVNDRNREIMFRSPRWSFYTSSGVEKVIAEEESSEEFLSLVISKSCPARLVNPLRVFKTGSATLVINNATVADTGTYGCTLVLSNGSSITRKTQLIVIGISLLILNHTKTLVLFSFFRSLFPFFLPNFQD